MATWYWEAATTQRQADYADRDGSAQKPWVLGSNRFGINPGAIDVSVFQPGDTLYVTGDHAWFNYDDSLVLNGVTGLTVIGQGATIRSLPVQNSTQIVVQDLKLQFMRLEAVNGLTVERCEFSGYTKAIDTVVTSNVDNVLISHCSIHDCTREGIEVFCHPLASRRGWVIDSNHIYNIGPYDGYDHEAIGLQRVTDCVISNNYIHDAVYGIHWWESGAGVIDGLTVVGNFLHDIMGGPVGWPSRAIMMSGGSTEPGSVQNITIQGNSIFRVGREGIRLQAPPGAPGLVCVGNKVVAVNQEYGERNTEYITAPGEWLLGNNHTLPSRGGRHISRRRR